MGITHPASGLADALFTPVQQRVLALLYGQPERRFQSAELIRLARSGTGAVQRLLVRLENAGLVSSTRSGNQKHYQANPASPIFAELGGLVAKTMGAAEPLRQALAPLAPHIHAAFIYGSLASGNDRASSDVDLMVLSDSLSYADVYEAIQGAEQALARPINPTVMTLADWRSKNVVPGSFVARIMGEPRLHLIGVDDDLS